MPPLTVVDERGSALLDRDALADIARLGLDLAAVGVVLVKLMASSFARAGSPVRNISTAALAVSMRPAALIRGAS